MVLPCARGAVCVCVIEMFSTCSNAMSAAAAEEGAVGSSCVVFVLLLCHPCVVI